MNILITGAWPQAQEHIDDIKALKHQVCFLQQENDPLPCDPHWVQGVICNGLFLHHPIEQFTNLRYIQLTSAGYDRVPMDYVRQHNIEIHNARGVYSIPMAEFAIAGVLSLYKRLNDFKSAQRERRWGKLRGIKELAGQTVLIVGCGSVGSECAKRFRAFGCPIVGVDMIPHTDEAYDEILPLLALDSALAKADVVILTVPLTDETRHLINAERLALLKPGAVLVNIARGALIDTPVLIDVLPNLTGAVLDVFENEPLPKMNSLWDCENVILTPHNSFVGNGNENRLWKAIINNLEDEL